MYRALGTRKEEVRRPVVSGIFYPDERGPLEAQVDRLAGGEAKREPAAAALVPHGSFASCGAAGIRICSPGSHAILHPTIPTITIDATAMTQPSLRRLMRAIRS